MTAWKQSATVSTPRNKSVMQVLPVIDLLQGVVVRGVAGRRETYRPIESQICASPAPLTGTASAAAGDEELQEFLHLFMSNRGILMTPFHNMALMCPDTTAADVDLHTALFDHALSELRG